MIRSILVSTAFLFVCAFARGENTSCGFDTNTLSFPGTPLEQARCLLRPVKVYGELGGQLAKLPAPLEELIGQPVKIDVAALQTYLQAQGITETDIGGPLTNHCGAKYFVIHDTSTPNYGDAPIPTNINTAAWGLNNLSRYTNRIVAHVFVNRLGQSIGLVPYATPWRATKLEVRVVGEKSRGTFVHTEMVQPRHRDPDRGPKNDAFAPDPGFTLAQYDRLALLYVSASLQHGTWLIPGYHCAIDAGIPDGHDDPQNFDLALWASRLDALIGAVGKIPATEPVRPPVIGLSHVALWVHDVEQSRRFYKGFLGFDEPYSLTNSNGNLLLTFIKINDRQAIELFPERETNSDRLYHISVETDDAVAMRGWLAAKGVKVPEKVGKGRIGNLNFNVSDPDEHTVEIVQYTPDGWTAREKGKFMPDTRISTRMMHAGILVGDLDASLQFYHDILGGTETWRGGQTNKPLSWVNVKLADSPDYVELMLYETLPEPTKRGAVHHICLEVADIDKMLAILKERAERSHYTRPMEIRTGINRKHQINVFDPDGTRVELMEPNTIDGKPAPSSTALPPKPVKISPK